jgi:hypothetical protein
MHFTNERGGLGSSIYSTWSAARDRHRFPHWVVLSKLVSKSSRLVAQGAGVALREHLVLEAVRKPLPLPVEARRDVTIRAPLVPVIPGAGCLPCGLSSLSPE